MHLWDAKHLVGPVETLVHKSSAAYLDGLTLSFPSSAPPLAKHIWLSSFPSPLPSGLPRGWSVPARILALCFQTSRRIPALQLSMVATMVSGNLSCLLCLTSNCQSRAIAMSPSDLKQCFTGLCCLLQVIPMHTWSSVIDHLSASSSTPLLWAEWTCWKWSSYYF